MIDFITINLGNDRKMGCQDEKYFIFSIRIFTYLFIYFLGRRLKIPLKESLIGLDYGKLLCTPGVP